MWRTVCSGQALPSATQVITLDPGWNLVSIQVGGPITPAAFQAALTHPARLIEIWGYAPSGTPLVPGEWQTYQPQVATFPSDLASLAPGRGYWVNVSQVTQATLTGARWDAAVALLPGWNLVGFPGLNFDSFETQELAAVFGTKFGRVNQVWTFEHSAGSRFVGYDTTAIPALRELNFVKPGRGYWVYALDAVTIQPSPFVALQADSDASPLQDEEPFSNVDPRKVPGKDYTRYFGTPVRWTGAGDAPYDLNGNAILDSPYTQDTLRFESGVDRKSITFGNTGEGTANWSIQNSIPWLFTAPFDPKDSTNTNRAKTASGTVSNDTDTITLYVDRTGLLPGQYTGQTITVHTGATTRVIDVILDVPSSSGDWKGYASAARVNGKPIGIGKVDLFLNLFMESPVITETRFRAVLNRDLSLLFPRDVFMNGVFYAGNDFSLTTNFQMGPGDRNAPPYDTFAHTPESNERGDKDYGPNGVPDGKLDPSNPFPFAVQREITLLGRRVNPDHMEGTYIEAIGGMLPGNQKIFIDGTFYLDRQSTEPTKRSIFNQTQSSITAIGGSSGANFREKTITVGSAVNIQNVKLTVNLDFPSSSLTVSLIGPTGKTVAVIRPGATATGSLTFNLSDFNTLIGQGAWKLRVAWDPSTGERGYWNSWSLNIEGLATYSVTGKLVSTGGTPALGGAQIVLAGSNVILQTTSLPDGTFSILGLTENDYSISVSKAGYAAREIAFFLNNANLNVGAYVDPNTNVKVGNANDDIELAPLAITDATLQAAPPLGSEPLFVQFDYLIPLSQLATLQGATTTTWTFGDGTPPITDTANTTDDILATSASHIYTDPGTYIATATIVGATSGSISRQSVAIHVHRQQPDANGPAHQITGVSFIGGIGAPFSDAGTPVQIASPQTIPSVSISVGGNPVTLTNVAQGIIYQQLKRDAAPFDFDRFPNFATAGQPLAGEFHFAATGEDNDFFTQPGTEFHALFPEGPGDGNGTGTYITYQQPRVQGVEVPDRWRVITTLGGAVFGDAPARVGDFVLQVGRVEP